MKTLLLMRHAKSSWKFPELEDHERPLNKRGRRDAPLMGQVLVERELIPQRILTSSAVRARQTAEALVEATGFQGPVDLLESLYLAEADAYIAVLQDLPDTVERVLVIGHNPGMETFLQILSGRIESLPTAVLAHVVVPIDHWSELTGETGGELVELWLPKELREEQEEEQKEKEKEKEKSKGKKKDKEKSKKKEK